MAIWSVVQLSETPGLRFDPEYYQPYYLELAKKLDKTSPIPIEDFAFVTDGIHNPPARVEEDGVTYLTAKCVKDNRFSLADVTQISVEDNTLNIRTEAQIDDVLITTTGTIGDAAVVNEDILPANIDRDLGIIRIQKGLNDIDPYYLSIFLNSKIGRSQSIRESTGNVQLHLFISKIKKILVPTGEKFNKLGLLARKAYEKRKESESLYAEAEALLIRELGLDAIDFATQTFYTANFIEASTEARLDAEYFQPKYQRTLEIMGSSGQTIKDVARLAKRRFIPQEDDTFQYIEIGGLSVDGYAESEEVLGENAPSRAQWIVREGDIITSTVRPIRRLTALIEKEQDGFVCSSGFAVLKPKEIRPELLMLYLRLPIVCEILDLHTTASMYPAISTTDLLKIPITLPGESVQKQLVQKIEDSRKARQKAKELLEEAKDRVEKLILGDG